MSSEPLWGQRGERPHTRAHGSRQESWFRPSSPEEVPRVFRCSLTDPEVGQYPPAPAARPWQTRILTDFAFEDTLARDESASPQDSIPATQQQLPGSVYMSEDFLNSLLISGEDDECCPFSMPHQDRGTVYEQLDVDRQFTQYNEPPLQPMPSTLNITGSFDEDYRSPLDVYLQDRCRGGATKLDSDQSGDRAYTTVPVSPSRSQQKSDDELRHVPSSSTLLANSSSDTPMQLSAV